MANSNFEYVAAAKQDDVPHVIIIRPEPYTNQAIYIKKNNSNKLTLKPSYDPELRLRETKRLCQAVWQDIISAQIIPVRTIKPATFIGKGIIDSLHQEIELFLEQNTSIQQKRSVIVLFDCALTPIQQRNLEKELHVKVLERTGLILEIFKKRAKTHEGRLQVDMAALSYQRTRLVRSWTHLERQRGGLGFVGGPGERQLELDKRMISSRIEELQKRVDSVRRTRKIQRESRKRKGLAHIALVGYTNAGKSSIFNMLTGSSVQSSDMLFATLDPTIRSIRIASSECTISDTVGFISDIPTELVAAFHATLEEVIDADLILRVRDISDPVHTMQLQTVTEVLDYLFANNLSDLNVSKKIIDVLNKVDKLEIAQQQWWENNITYSDNQGSKQVLFSTYTGSGKHNLFDMIATELGFARLVHFQNISADVQSDVINWLNCNAHIVRCDPIVTDDQTEVALNLDAQLDSKTLKKFTDMFPAVNYISPH